MVIHDTLAQKLSSDNKKFFNLEKGSGGHLAQNVAKIKANSKVDSRERYKSQKWESLFQGSPSET